ncbi:hypothetical protein B0H14DRAFT_839041 [Mycena olivaceomarginata]|nr:hypothetical protein B0H14DRAFT_839041 [Mycena olivaceomarginata]
MMWIGPFQGGSLSSSRYLANERDKLNKASSRRSQRLKSQRVQHIQGRAGKETPTQNQPSIKHRVSGARTTKSHTRIHSVTATGHTVSPAPLSLGRPLNIPRPIVQSEKPISDTRGPKRSQNLPLNREGTSTGKTCIIPATSVSGSQHIPSPPKKVQRRRNGGLT